MKLLFAAFLLTFAFAFSAKAQDVTIPAPLLEAANKAFVEVDQLRKENAALKSEIAAKDDLITALTDESAAKDILIAEKNQVIAQQDGVIKALEERDKTRLAEIEALRKLKCDKNIYLFGAIKTIRCK